MVAEGGAETVAAGEGFEPSEQPGWPVKAFPVFTRS